MNLLNRADSYTEFLQHNRVANGPTTPAPARFAEGCRPRSPPPPAHFVAEQPRRRQTAGRMLTVVRRSRPAPPPERRANYAPIAYSVQQMTREMGIRMALGAEANEGRNMVVVQGMRLSLAGILIGLAAAFGLSRLIRSLLFGVTASDPAVFVIVPIVSGIFALLAVWVPAQRATRI